MDRARGEPDGASSRTGGALLAGRRRRAQIGARARARRVGRVAGVIDPGGRIGWRADAIPQGKLKQTASPSEDEGPCRAKSRQRGYAVLAPLERAPRLRPGMRVLCWLRSEKRRGG